MQDPFTCINIYHFHVKSVRRTGRIVGGEGAKTGEFPFMALIGYRLENGKIEYQCGGALINKYAINYT